MKTLTNIVGILLIILGIATLIYKGYSYKTQEKVAEIGPLKITSEQEKTVYFSPAMSGISIVVGVVLVIVARVGRIKK